MMAPAAPASVSDRIPSVPPALRDLFVALHRAVPDACLVGGAVRDLLTGRAPQDLDVVTSRDAREAAERARPGARRPRFPLDEARGQYRVALAGQAADEIDVSRIAGLHEDLARRDFTIDALAAEIRVDGGLGPRNQ